VHTDIAIDDYRCVDMNNYIRGRRERERRAERKKERTKEEGIGRKEGRHKGIKKERLRTVHTTYTL
jgi:hypothetical protein